MMDRSEWQAFLAQWSAALLRDPQVVANVPLDVIRSGWLGFPGATAAQVTGLEARLGAPLPPSYRTFLTVSNGWCHTTGFIYRLWSTEEVEWFAVSHQDWVDAYVAPAGPPVPDEDYYVYGEAQSSVTMRPEYLQTALEISDVGDSAIYLLNPRIVTPDGEWEAWFFANWLPGAHRYRSFEALMRREYESYLRLREGSAS